VLPWCGIQFQFCGDDLPRRQCLALLGSLPIRRCTSLLTYFFLTTLKLELFLEMDQSQEMSWLNPGIRTFSDRCSRG